MKKMIILEGVRIQKDHNNQLQSKNLKNKWQ